MNVAVTEMTFECNSVVGDVACLLYGVRKSCIVRAGVDAV